MMLRTTIFAWLFLIYFSGNLDAQQKQKAKPVTLNTLASSMANGKNIYTRSCLTCHQADGLGVQRMNPPLAGTEYVLGEKKRLIRIVLKGFNEDVEIKGQYYSNIMPGLDFLTDKEVADVLTYVRNSFGNKASRILPEEVKKLRDRK